MKKIIIAACIVWIVLLLAALAIFIPQRSRNTDDPIQDGQNPSIADLEDMPDGKAIDMDVIVGQWQSNRMDQSMLTLREDGTYEDPDWLGFGTYDIKNNYLILQNGTADAVLKYRIVDDEEQLFFTIADYQTIYHRATDAEIQEKLENQEKLQAENDCQTGEILNESYPLLIDSAWEANGIVISFRKDSFTIQENENVTTYQYKVPSAEHNEGDPGGYTFYWEVTKDGIPQQAEPLMLLFGIDGAKERSIYFELNGRRFEITKNIAE